MKNTHFGFLELIGSIILLVLDPDRRNNKKYLNRKYLKINRITGVITISTILIVLAYYTIK